MKTVGLGETIQQLALLNKKSHRLTAATPSPSNDLQAGKLAQTSCIMLLGTWHRVDGVSPSCLARMVCGGDVPLGITLKDYIHTVRWWSKRVSALNLNADATANV